MIRNFIFIVLMILGSIMGAFLLWSQVVAVTPTGSDPTFETVLWVFLAGGATCLSSILCFLMYMWFKEPSYWAKWFRSLRNLSWLLARVQETGNTDVNKALKLFDLPAEDFRREINNMRAQ